MYMCKCVSTFYRRPIYLKASEMLQAPYRARCRQSFKNIAASAGQVTLVLPTLYPRRDDTLFTENCAGSQIA